MSIAKDLIRHVNKGKERVGYWTEYHINKRGYGVIEYLHKECTASRGIELFRSPYDYCPNCGMKMKRREIKDTEVRKAKN